MRAVLLGVLAAVLFANPAAAQANVSFPNQRPITERVTWAQINLAVAYWEARGVTGCPSGIRSWWVPQLPSSTGGGDVAAERAWDCELWMNDVFVPDDLGPSTRLARQCAIIVHGVGHALGLLHTDTGVMSTAGDSEVPLECHEWAREIRSTWRALRKPNMSHLRLGYVQPGRTVKHLDRDVIDARIG